MSRSAYFHRAPHEWTRHLVPDGALLGSLQTLCGRLLRPAERWTVTEIAPATGARDCALCRRRDRDVDGLPVLWRWRDRATGAWQETPIRKLEDSHLLHAIRFLERKASEFGRITHIEDVEAAARLLSPGYEALRREAERRWPAPKPAAGGPRRAITLPDEPEVKG